MNQIRSTDIPGDARIAFVQACWHRDIVDRGRDGFLAELALAGFARERVDCHEVPGSLEIPLHAKLIASAGRHAAIVAAGLVVDGGIYRHEFVAQTVIDGLMRVQLDTEVPVLSMVLTPQRFHEHAEHLEFFGTHMVKKGAEAAQACLQTMAGVARLRAAAAQRAA